MSTHPAILYEQRLNRYVTAMRNEKPDRVPIRFFAEEFAGLYAGYSNFLTACDYEKAFEATYVCARDFGWDAAFTNLMVNWMGLANSIGWKGIGFPGVDVDVDSVSQWTEPNDELSAFMKADEYDLFIEDPTVYLANVWLPRFTKHIQPAGAPVTYAHNLALINGSLNFWKYIMAFGTWAQKFRNEIGVVPAAAGTLKAPLDILGDKLRGYTNFAFDLMERRDKVAAACEALMPHLCASALGGADPDHYVPVTIWMHRGCVPFVSHDIFNRMYWPTLKPIIEEIWAQGHQTLFYAEGNWDAHLEKFAELPHGSIIYHVDRGDVMKAKKVLGDKFCISGGFPNQLLAFGTPQEVKARVKKILAEVASDGGYIMDAGALVMNDAKVENVRALTEATLEYGVYSQSPSQIAVPFHPRPDQQGRHPFKQHPHRPGECVPWLEKQNEFPAISGDPHQVKKMWQSVDMLGYVFLWTNLTW